LSSNPQDSVEGGVGKRSGRWTWLSERLRREALPEVFGVAVVVLLVASAVGAVVLAGAAFERERVVEQRERGNRMARLLAAAFARCSASVPEDANDAAREWATAAGATWVRWTDAEGAVRAEWPHETLAASAPSQDRGGETFVAPVLGADHSVLGRVELAISRTGLDAQTATGLRFAAGVAAGAVVLAYLALYRRARRQLRPLAAIRRSLCDYGAGVEQDLRALAMSASLGQVAECWNRLIEQVANVKRLAEGDPSGRTADTAVHRFESRTQRRLLNALPLGVLRVQGGEKIVYANAAADRLLGYGPDGLTGKAITEAIGEQYANALLRGQSRSPREVLMTRKLEDSDYVATLRLAATAGGDASDDIVVTVEDVSRMREVERSRDSFLYHITHELRTPLTNIHAYAETLTRPDFDDEQTRKECYNVIVSETRRLSTLVEDILNVSQLEVGMARIELDDVDIVRLLRAMVQDHLAAADGKKVDLTLSLPPKAPRVRGDKQRLAMLFGNLIGNAVKYTPAGGRVDVSLEVVDEMARVIVRDSGIGIPPEEQARVFEKFYRASNAQSASTPGTGLGLAIAREVARLHGGDIWLSSEPGKGSTFVAEVPVSSTEPAGRTST
jgi:signal transduction histidine kinase